jgi:hypothetical protein
MSIPLLPRELKGGRLEGRFDRFSSGEIASGRGDLFGFDAIVSEASGALGQKKKGGTRSPECRPIPFSPNLRFGLGRFRLVLYGTEHRVDHGFQVLDRYLRLVFGFGSWELLQPFD